MFYNIQHILYAPLVSRTSMKGVFPANYVKCIIERRIFTDHLVQQHSTRPAHGEVLLPEGGNSGLKQMPNIKDSNILDKSQKLKQEKYDFEEDYEKAKAEILTLQLRIKSSTNKKIMCHMSRVTCDMSQVMCHMSHVTFHLSLTPRAQDLLLLTRPISTVDWLWIKQNKKTT